MPAMKHITITVVDPDEGTIVINVPTVTEWSTKPIYDDPEVFLDQFFRVIRPPELKSVEFNFKPLPDREGKYYTVTQLRE